MASDFDFLRVTHIAQLYPERVSVFPLGSGNLLGMARQNAKRDAFVKLAVPDEWIKQLQGPEENRPLCFYVHIPRELVDIAGASLVLPNIGPERASRVLLPGGR